MEETIIDTSDEVKAVTDNSTTQDTTELLKQVNELKELLNLSNEKIEKEKEDRKKSELESRKKEEELQKTILESRRLIEQSRKESQLINKVNQAIGFYSARLIYTNHKKRVQAVKQTRAFLKSLIRERDPRESQKEYNARIKEVDAFIFRHQLWVQNHESMLIANGRESEIITGKDGQKELLSDASKQEIKRVMQPMLNSAERLKTGQMVQDIHNESLLQPLEDLIAPDASPRPKP